MPSRRAAKDEEEDLEIDEAPTSINPYEVLGLETDSTEGEVKSAYRKAALRNHPDKASPEDKEAATSAFQDIVFAYAILSDERRRKRYDTTGRTTEGDDIEDDDFDWYSFYREQYRESVTTEKIDAFAQKYKGSDEEKEAVLKYYEMFKGKMDKLYQNVMLSDPEDDEERFRAIIDQAIEDGTVEEHQNYTGESEKSRKRRIDNARKRKRSEAKEAEQHAADTEEGKKGKKGGKAAKVAKGEDDLAALIQGRQSNRSTDFFADLEAKYAPKGMKGKRDADEPPEEAFAKTEAGRKSKRTKKADTCSASSRTVCATIWCGTWAFLFGVNIAAQVCGLEEKWEKEAAEKGREMGYGELMEDEDEDEKNEIADFGKKAAACSLSVALFSLDLGYGITAYRCGDVPGAVLAVERIVKAAHMTMPAYQMLYLPGKERGFREEQSERLQKAAEAREIE